MPCPLPRRIERVLMSIASPLTRPSPIGRRVGIRIVTFEACSGFTQVTARRIAQPPSATFVTRLQPVPLPARAARQLPDQSTTPRVESSSTGNPRLRGALPNPDSCIAANKSLFNHLVGAGDERRRHVEAERLRHDQVNDEVELGRLLDRKIGGLRPPQNLVD